MQLPNAVDAVVDIAKIRDYCLNMEHPLGRHKARVFASTLGLRVENAGVLRDALLVAARTAEAIESERDIHGRRFVVDFHMNGPKGQVAVRSAWIIRSGEETPRLTSCFVLL